MIIGADSTHMPDTNPFWSFSLQLYRQPGVAEACLELQASAGLDVNLLLLSSWYGWRGLALKVADLHAAEEFVASWRGAVVLPVRQLRQALHARPQAQPVYELLKQAELEGERVQQTQLYEWSLASDMEACVGALEINLREFAVFLQIAESVFEAYRAAALLAFKTVPAAPLRV